MSIEMLTFVIATFCQMKNPHVSHDKKVACFDYFVNCAIVKDGQTTEKIVNLCKEEWAEIERNQNGL